MATIAILGAGMMGSAFGFPLSDRGHRVRLIGTPLDREIIEQVAATGRHPKLALELFGPVAAFQHQQLAAALEGVDAIALGVSSAGVRWAAESLARCAPEPPPIAMVSKGLFWDGAELLVLPDLFARVFASAGGKLVEPVGVAGPCIAGELARRVPTTAVFTSRSVAAAERWAELVRGNYYRVWTEPDVVGVEICAALKNAYAMGIAFASGIHARAGGSPGSLAQHNYEAAVFAQSVWEMRRLIGKLGGDPDQASWLPGVGDLNVTCNGGRTGRFGHWLGYGLGREQAIARMDGATLECLEILATIRSAAALLDLSQFPLLEQLAAVALDDAPVDMPFDRFFGGSVTARSPGSTQTDRH